MDIKKLTQELEVDEGFVSHAYQDNAPEKYWTIGIGRMIDKRKNGGITKDEAYYLLANDINKVQAQVQAALPWVTKLTDARQRALCNMAFQMGINGLLGFKNTLGYIEQGNYTKAAENARLSLWYKQTPVRAERVIQQILKG